MLSEDAKKQLAKMMRKAFDRGHEKTLKKIAKILGNKDGK